MEARKEPLAFRVAVCGRAFGRSAFRADKFVYDGLIRLGAVIRHRERVYKEVRRQLRGTGAGTAGDRQRAGAALRGKLPLGEINERNN